MCDTHIHKHRHTNTHTRFRYYILTSCHYIISNLSKSAFIWFWSHNWTFWPIPSGVGLLRQGQRTLRPCNLVAHGFSKWHGSDVPRVMETCRNHRPENTHVVQIQRPVQIELCIQSLKCVGGRLCCLSRFKVPLHLLLLTSRNGR
jgi:hypothetical protein